MQRRSFLGCGAGAMLASRSSFAAPLRPPNIVLLYADDLGYGDTGCYGATAVRTPNIDRLARGGVRFTDAHAAASTCTPSRFSLLTGEYAFRTPEARILPGDAPALIRPGRPTLASMLQQRGYRTAVVGKWHLGLGGGALDWNTEIRPGPLDIGFDECFIIPATGDRVPCVYVENRRVANLDPSDPITVSYKGSVDGGPTGKANPELLRMHPSHGHDNTIVNGISRIGFMRGGKSALWNDETMADVLTSRATDYIGRSAGKPFFLYFATHDIHVPRVPNPRYGSSTTMGPRGNAIAEFDDCVGRIIAALEQRNLLRDTLILVSSDNGAVVDDGYRDQAVEKLGGHRPNGAIRGGKGSKFEGGTRIPFIAHWPARVKPGVSPALIGQLDLFKSLATLTGATLPAGAAPDSEDVLPALLGESKKGRQFLVEQSGGLGLRDGAWKYIEPSPGPAMSLNTNTETGNLAQPQLYDLAADPAEQRNVATAEPARLEAMAAKLQQIRQRK
ncbi:MAG: arylsulfatase [Acidobacteria bacterium]|nr:arylsulfatase [Acidobacteriota bacterium]